MFGLRSNELLLVVAVLGAAAAYYMHKGIPLKRLAILGLCILASTVILLDLVESSH